MVSHKGCASSGPLAGGQAQARQVKLAVLGVAQVHDIRWQHGRGNGAQPPDDIPCLIELSDTSVASSEIATGHGEARGLLEREEQLWDRLVGASAEKVGGADQSVNRPAGSAWAKTQRSLSQLDGAVGLAGHQAEEAAVIPPAGTYNAIKNAEPVGEIARYGIAASEWRHFERLEHLPCGMLPVADAICRYNPVYGQGMSVAALEACILRQLLGTRTLQREGSPRSRPPSSPKSSR